MDEEGISFTAVFSKVSSMVDGGYKIAFDVSEQDAQSMFQLSQLKDSLLQIAVIPIGVKDGGQE
jgi:hypothetical protein